MSEQKLVTVDSRTERKLVDDQKYIISKYDIPYDVKTEEGLEFASNLGISYEDFKELIMVTDVEDALEELKQKI